MEPLSANDPRMIGEFRLHAQLGAGGMGQVYLGFSPAGRAVAVKVIHPQFASDQEFLRRFSHEVAAASAVGGMYTAPVVDYDLRSGTPWLATAYVPGPTLATFIGRHGALPAPALWRLAAGLAEALRAVHGKGLIHRDLKPANVLLADGGPHVIDFGISRAASSATQLTSAGTAVGTPGYMSPEQAQAQPVGAASDIFSLGCVLAYAATGSPPFKGENPAAVLYQIVSAEPDLGAIPPTFRQVVQACLRKNPEDRPEPGRLIAVISEFGPATPPTLGSFWPDAVARAIAAEQAAQTPAGLTPPAPPAAAPPTGAGAMSRATGLSPQASPGSRADAPAPSGRPPTALAMPASEPAAGATGHAPQVAGATGHAPMISDGYYAAAQRSAAPAPVLSGPSTPPAPARPQAYSAWQPSTARQPGGQGYSYQGPVPSYQAPVSSYPAEQPSGADPLARYAPGRGKPLTAEVPAAVRNAIRLMYGGFAATVIAAAASLPVLLRYSHDANAAKIAAVKAAALGENARSARDTAIWQAQTHMAGIMSYVLVADLLGLACWAWLALAARRGRGWTRGAAAVLLAMYTIGTLLVLFRTESGPGADLATLLVWACGVAALIPLWSQQAREFFYSWRRN